MKIIITETQLKYLVENSVYQEFDYPDALKVEAELVKRYGTTTNYKAAGYITPQGYLLDFGAGGMKRELDHRDINGIFDDLNIDMGKYNDKEWEYSNSTNMLALLDMGFIRYMPESDTFDMKTMPSQEQFGVLRNIITRRNGYVVLDLNGEGGYVEYERDTPTNYIIEQIKRYFNYHEPLKTYADAYAEEDLMEQAITHNLQFDYWFDDPHLPTNLKDRLDVGKRPTPEYEMEINNSRKLLGKDPHGTPVYTVDGELVRQHYYPDFSLGGNDMAYPNFIPKNEIWVEQDLIGDSRKTTIAHESIERYEMFTQDKPYDAGTGENEHGAHIDALNLERKIRLGDARPLKLTK